MTLVAEAPRTVGMGKNMPRQKRNDDSNVEQQTYTVKEVAIMLHVGLPTVYKMVANKELPSVKFGGRVVISKKYVDNLINQVHGSGPYGENTSS